MRRRILKGREYSGSTFKAGGNALLSLECGHVKRVQISREPKTFVNCEECDGAAAYAAGLPESANPHFAKDKHSEAGVAWRNGWKAAKLEAFPPQAKNKPPARLLTLEEVLAELEKLIAEAGSAKTLAGKWADSGHTSANESIIGRIRHGKDAPTPAVLKAMGLRRIVLYEEDSEQ